jgi:hypothetical protein
MMGSGLVAALTPVLTIFTELDVRHFGGGSVASSAYGVARASLDVDVVAEFEAAHVRRFVLALQDVYVVDEARVRAAVDARRSLCAGHAHQLGGASPLPNLMEVKG